MTILSIQSQVVAGHVGNSASVFALQRLGREVWAVPTVLLSHHPGHGGAQGGPVDVALLDRILDGLATRGCFGRCEAVLSGYLGVSEDGEIVMKALARARAESPNAVYLCDPVLGDDGRTYVGDEIVGISHNLALFADIITPNAYELFLLTGQGLDDRAQALHAMRSLQAMGPGIVLLSSFAGGDTAPGTLDVMAVDGAAAWRVTVPRLAQKFSGPGDLFAALFLHFWLPGRDTALALGKACAAVFGILKATAARGADELALIPAQHLLVAPDQKFVVEVLA